MAQRTPTVVDPRLVRAMAHPTRVHALNILNERVASPKQLAGEIGEALNNVSYHVNVLVELGCVELVETEAKGNAVEHFYRATQRQFFTAEEWEVVPKSVRHAITATIVQMISEDIGHAVSAGTFDEVDGNHLSRTPMVLDQVGWKEVASELTRTVENLLEIQARCSERLATSDETGILTKVQMMQFKSPTRPAKP